MKSVSRRTLLRSAALFSFASGAAPAAAPKLRIGVTDWNLKLGANPDAVTLAAKIGFEGVQVSFGRRLADDRMPVDRPDVVARYLELAQSNRIELDGTCVRPPARQRPQK